MGALTTSNASLACWRSALRQRPVNVLFAHCRPGEPGAVEFADGLYGVEEVAAADLLHARHPYTRGLLECLPTLSHKKPRLIVMQRDPSWLEQ